MTADLPALRWPHRGWASALRWQLNQRLLPRLRWLNYFAARLTIVDAFGAPGDTLLTAIVCRHIKQQYPRIRLNCITPNPELLAHDRHIDSVNEREDYLSLWHWYLDLLTRKDAKENVLSGSMRRLGIENADYRAHVYLTEEERIWAEGQVPAGVKPVLSFNTRSKEPVKNWPQVFWGRLIERLRADFELIHLGDDQEPEFEGVRRFAGCLSRRQSMALLSRSRLHIGADSFLMHAANGLNVPSIIILGGSRTPENVGYSTNTNLFTAMPCGPCWIHASRGEQCEHGLACLEAISVERVLAAVVERWRQLNSEPPAAAAMPVYNSDGTIQAALAAMRAQEIRVGEVLVVDDGSRDQSAELAHEAGARVVRHRQNLGRGAARATIVEQTRSPLVFMCDASLAPSADFLTLALPYFEDSRVAAVFGRVVQSRPKSSVERWRQRHLFKEGQSAGCNQSALLATGACVLRRSAVQAVGGFNPGMRCAEDADLGVRLLAAGWKVISDSRLVADDLSRDSVISVLRRFARWNSPKGMPMRQVIRQFAYALKVMMREDLRAHDPAAAILSFVAPFFQLRGR